MRYTSAKSRPTASFDADLLFKDAGLVAADAAGTVSSAAKVVDVGTGRFEGKMIIDITAIEVASGDEGYRIMVQGSNDSGFSSGVEVELASRLFGDSSVTLGDVDDVVGRYELHFSNVDVNGLPYRYLRVYTDVQGTIATGINFTAFADKK